MNVTVAFNGGATASTLSDIGTLTVTGDVKFALPDLTGLDSYSATLFTATSIPAASKGLLSAGVPVDLPRSWVCSVAVSDTSVVLRVNKRGTTIVIR